MDEIISIALLSIKISVLSTLISTIIALPLAIILGLREGRIVKTFINAFTGLPPVIAGVAVYLLFSNDGLFGSLSWLYTEKVIIIAQVIIVIPIICANIYPSVESMKDNYLLTSFGLNLPVSKMKIQLVKENKFQIMSAVLSGFGRAISEVGAVMIVGGNIRYKTRVLTSAIVLENNKGNYPMSIKLGIILMLISFAVSFTAMFFSRRSNDKDKKN
ncbi:MAG: ABC transporter permease [Anaerococcus sp.]|nr:ABC transporter permease [Peptoniphilaceae bacterium]MDY3056106.1 ABC transporter permease [Anaerococcus sp.]